MGTPRLTWRRLWNLVHNLPAESATVQAQLGPSGQWSTTDYLLANIFDVLQVGNWQRAGRRNAPRPKPIKRPGADDANRYGRRRKRRRRMTPEQLDAALQRRRARAAGTSKTQIFA